MDGDVKKRRNSMEKLHTRNARTMTILMINRTQSVWADMLRNIMDLWEGSNTRHARRMKMLPINRMATIWAEMLRQAKEPKERKKYEKRKEHEQPDNRSNEGN